MFVTEKDEPMVRCCNIECPRGWFHLSCVQPPLTVMPGEKDWYCSKKCEISKAYIYCICQEKKGEADKEMLECFSGTDCKRHQYYHLDCLFKLPRDCKFLILFNTSIDCLFISREWNLCLILMFNTYV